MSNKAVFKIGLDYHGVVSLHPEYFAAFAREAISRGHEIHIITGGPEQAVAQKLQAIGLPYTRIFAIYDYYAAKGQISYLQDGDYHIPDILWDSAKGQYCSDEKINIHIDDSEKYIKWFSTPYCRYDKDSGACVLAGGAKVDFAMPADMALTEIEQAAKDLR